MQRRTPLTSLLCAEAVLPGDTNVSRCHLGYASQTRSLAYRWRHPAGGVQQLHGCSVTVPDALDHVLEQVCTEQVICSPLPHLHIPPVTT